MKNKLVFVILAMVVLAIGLMAAGCASAPISKAPPITPKLYELLGKYLGHTEEIWGDYDGGKVTWVYFLDPLRFDEFKAELDAGGEYSEDGSNENNRDWAMGLTFLRWCVRPTNFILNLQREDNSGVYYMYDKVSRTAAPKTDELLRKYMGAEPQTWGKEMVYIYYLDPLRFDEFKAELDAGGEYAQTDTWTEKRDWERGKTFAQLAVRPNGEFELRLMNADNSVVEYRYRKAR